MNTISSEHEKALTEAGIVFTDHSDNVVHVDFAKARQIREAAQKALLPKLIELIAPAKDPNAKYADWPIAPSLLL